MTICQGHQSCVIYVTWYGARMDPTLADIFIVARELLMGLMIISLITLVTLTVVSE